MICPYCGKENPDDGINCMYCGGPLAVAEEKSPIDTSTLMPKVDVIQAPAQPTPAYDVPAQTADQPSGGFLRNRTWWLVGCLVIVLLFICCGIGLIAVYRFSNGLTLQNTPSSTISSVSNTTNSTPRAQSPNKLFYDDFSDPNSGWDSVDTADYYSDYYNNAYRITVHKNMFDSWSNPDDHNYGDTITEVDATKNGGPDDNDFGVICRYQNANEFYYAVISSDGYYGITKVTSNSSDLLGLSELQPSNYINKGLASNHIRFDCIGNVLTLYINGHQVDQENDSSYTTGNVGLIAGTYDTPGTDILFDNFAVSQP